MFDRLEDLISREDEDRPPLPIPLMILAGPILGLVYVVFLPLVSFVVFLGALVVNPVRAFARVLRPSWQPGFAFFVRKKK